MNNISYILLTFCLLTKFIGVSQDITFEAMENLQELAVNDYGSIQSMLYGPDEKYYFIGTAQDIDQNFKQNLYSSSTIDGDRELLASLDMQDSYELMLYCGELVIYRPSGRPSYIYRNGQLEEINLELDESSNTWNDNRVYIYDNDSNQLLFSDDKGVSFQTGHTYSSIVEENRYLSVGENYLYNIVSHEIDWQTASDAEIFLYRFDLNLNLVDSLFIKYDDYADIRQMWFENDDKLVIANTDHLIKIDLGKNEVEIGPSIAGYFYDQIIKRDNHIYFKDYESLYYIDISDLSSSIPVLIEDLDLFISDLYLTADNNIVFRWNSKKLFSIDENNALRSYSINIDPRTEYFSFIHGPNGELVLNANFIDRYISLDNGDSWMDKGDTYLSQYDYDLGLESYPAATIINVSGDTTAAIRFDDGCGGWAADPTKPQPAYDSVTETYIRGHAFFYSTDNGATWLQNYKYVSPPNTSMKIVDGLLHIYAGNQADFSFEGSTTMIPPSLKIYDHKNEFELISEESLEAYPLGSYNGSFRMNDLGELHQHPRFNDDYSYIDDRQLAFSPAGELHLVPDSDASYVIRRQENITNIYYRADRDSEYQQLNVSPYNLPKGELHVGKDYLILQGETLFFRAAHPEVNNQSLSGEIYLDENTNCAKDDNATNTFGWIINLDGPTEKYTYYVQSSAYDFNLDPGSYEMTISSPWQEWENCEPVNNIELDTDEKITLNVPVQTEDFCSRLSIDVSPDLVRRCFAVRHKVLIKNLGSASSDNTTVTLNISDNYSFESSSTAHQLLSDSEIEFSLDPIDPFSIHEFDFYLIVDCDAEIGDLHCYEVEITSDNSCSSWDRNLSKACENNRGSWDPNDIRSFSGTPNLDVLEIEKEAHLDYIIRFQNTGTDTALNVRVLNPLPANVDISTFEVLNSSHDYQLSILENNTLEIKYPNIYLPDSIVDEKASHGFFKYRVFPTKEIEAGAEIYNQAEIYFDFNEAVITNTDKVNIKIQSATQEVSARSFPVYPNPSTGQFRADLSNFTNASHCEVIDNLGVIIYSQVIRSKLLDLDLSDQADGFYLIRILDNTKHLGISKVVKN